MTAKMTRKEREAFLADVHIGVLAIPDGDRGPLTMPIWYEYEPGGDLWMTTAKRSRKGKLLTPGGRISLCVQKEEPPCKYVSLEGPIVAIEAADTDHDTRHPAHRYMGVKRGDDYITAMRDFMEGVVPILVRMRPERWLTWDDSKDG